MSVLVDHISFYGHHFSRSMRRWLFVDRLSQHHSLHLVLLIKLDRAIHARRLHTLAMSSNTEASCVHSQSFVVCKYCLLRSHTLSPVCLTLFEQAGLVFALRSFRCPNPSTYPYTPDVAAPMRQRARHSVPSRWRWTGRSQPLAGRPRGRCCSLLS
jgi:hypothetical protein